MSDIRPIDLPELRAELVKRIAAECDQFHLDGTSQTWPVQIYNKSDLFHVSASMAELARAARESLERFTPDAYDIPSPSGMIYFSGGTGDSVAFSCGDIGVMRGAFWLHDAGSLMVLPFGDEHHDRTGATPSMPQVHRETMFSVPLDGSELVSAAENAAFHSHHFLALLLTTWILMRQPLAETPLVEADRAARKRLRRAGHEPASVRVIELRRPKGTSGHGDSDREYHHQWIVRGHWRQHWYPKRQVHRPVWIAPHVKGPEGAPLVGGEKVYAWKR